MVLSGVRTDAHR